MKKIGWTLFALNIIATIYNLCRWGNGDGGYIFFLALFNGVAAWIVYRVLVKGRIFGD